MRPPKTFMLYTIKIDIRNMSENREFKWENDSKLVQAVHFLIFFPEKSQPLKKNNRHYFIFY